MDDESEVSETSSPALADPMRQRLLDLISQAGVASASTLAKELPISRQAIAKHLRVLADAGLVVSRPDGRSVAFSVRTDRTDDTARWLADRSAEWTERADRLAALAGRRSASPRSDP